MRRTKNLVREVHNLGHIFSASRNLLTFQFLCSIIYKIKTHQLEFNQQEPITLFLMFVCARLFDLSVIIKKYLKSNAHVGANIIFTQLIHYFTCFISKTKHSMLMCTWTIKFNLWQKKTFGNVRLRFINLFWFTLQKIRIIES